MTVALDAYTDGPGAVTNPSWTHVVSGTPRAAIVATFATTFDALSFTYGGTDMGTARVVIDNSVGGEMAFVRMAIFMLDNVSSGNQTVAFTGGTSQVKIASSYTLTSAGGAIELVTTDSGESTAIANPSGTLALGGRDSWCHTVFGSGQDAITGITPFASWTADRELDSGTTTQGWYSYDTVASANVTAGWTQTIDDAIYASAAFAEAASGRIMSSLTNFGGLAGMGGIVGTGGGLAG